LLSFANTSLYAQKSKEVTAKMILGNAKYQGICYGGYRTNTRDKEPTVSEVKEDLKILAALNIKIIRTYNLHHEEILNVLKAITEIQKENPKFPPRRGPGKQRRAETE
jgi:hypothetical protein